MTAALAPSSHTLHTPEEARHARAPRPAPAADPDAALVACAQRELPGPSPAFEKLVARHRARVERRAAAVLGARQDAEDAAQDVFLNVFRALPRYEQRQPFAHWLERIVTNTCRMHLRSRRRHDRRMRAVALEQLCNPPAPARPAADARRDVARVCARLSDVNRTAFVLRAGAELPYGDIAEKLGISESAAKMRVRRAQGEALRLAHESLRDG